MKKTSLYNLLMKYESLFNRELGRWKGPPHTIYLKDKVYKIPQVYEVTLKLELAQLIKLGVFKKVNHLEWASLYFIIPKKDHTIRFLTNLRELGEGIFLGNQLKRKIVVSEADWSFGDAAEFSSWIQYSLSKTLSISSRLKFVDTDSLSGRNLLIMAPVQTANPNNYGGKELHLGLGMNLNLDLLPGGKDTIGIEILKPLDQDKNNLQMKTDFQIIIGYQKSI